MSICQVVICTYSCVMISFIMQVFSDSVTSNTPLDIGKEGATVTIASTDNTADTTVTSLQVKACVEKSRFWFIFRRGMHGNT